MFYDDCVRMCEDFAPNFGNKRTNYCITTVHHLTLPFHQGIFYQKQHHCPSPPILRLSVPNFGNKRTSCFITTVHHLTLPFHQRNFFTKNNITVLPHLSHVCLFPRLKVELKGRHFDTIELIKAELQAVNLKHGRSARNGAHRSKGTTSSVTVASRPKSRVLTSWQHQSRKLWMAPCILF
jgi:hypothetical protein